VESNEIHSKNYLKQESKQRAIAPPALLLGEAHGA
jgi:hypothetical protein